MRRYRRWLRPPLGKKRRVLRSSRPCYQDCWHTDLQLKALSVNGAGRGLGLYASLTGLNLAGSKRLKGPQTDLGLCESLLLRLSTKGIK